MSAATARRPVTIVVPVYGDLPGLLGCVRSLFETVDTSIDQVLLVNDCGPEADEIERALLDLIADRHGFRYERNARNLGFVGNCNRAVTELDRSGNDVLLLNSDTITTPGFVEELSAVLHLDPHHGVVCARSNNATIASLPHRLAEKRPRAIERSQAVFDALAPRLPRFSIAPVSMGFCFLVRRELIDRFGLFDEIYAPGYGEENDFCLRINAHGYSSLIAHRAIVFHAGAQSFAGEARMALRAAHEKILVSRYPFYTAAVQTYLWRDIDPIDHFADVLVPEGRTVHLLIHLESSGVDQVNERAVALLDRLRLRSRDDVHSTLAVAPADRERLAARYRGITVVPHDQVSGIFDLGVALDGVSGPGTVVRLNRTAVRWAVRAPEVVALRSWSARLADGDSRPATEAAIRRADALLIETDSAEAGLSGMASAFGLGMDELPTAMRLSSSADDDVDALLALAARPVDDERLRRRWRETSTMADASGVDAAPVEPRIVRIARAAQARAPRLTSAARRIVGGVRRRMRR